VADSTVLAEGVVVLVWGAVMTTWVAVKASRASASTTWPATTGQITASEVQEGPSSGRLVPVVRYRAAIVYHYDVDGTQRAGTRVSMDEAPFGSRSWAEERVERYPVATAVRVWYDPDDPSHAVLEPGINGEHVRGLAAALLFLVLGVVVMLRSIR
jgi:hypothetical protein